MEDNQAREAEAARREADALRRDREKADRAMAREAELARREREKARATAERDRQRAQREARKTAEREQADEARRERERARAEQERLREAERAQAQRERAAQQAAREAGRALREAEQAQRAAALAQQRAAREAEKARREAERVTLAAPSTDDPAADPRTDLPPLPRDLEVLWRRPAPGRRGPRPGLSLEQIADAAIALADAEGLDAVSMARLAESLGFTTMSLYRYVSAKDEVLSLMTDRAVGRPPHVGPEVGGWRARIELLLSLQRPVLRAHPWLVRTTAVLHAVGPNRLAWMEAMLAALEDTPLREDQKVAVVGTLSAQLLDELRIEDAYAARTRAVVGEAAAAAGRPDDAAGGGSPDPAHKGAARAEPAEAQRALGDRPVAADLSRLLAWLASPAEHPALHRAVVAHGFDVEAGPDAPSASEDGDRPEDARLDFGTVLLLDGVERLVDRMSVVGGTLSP